MPPVRGLLPPCFISGLYTEPPSTAATRALQPPVPTPAPAVARGCLPRASRHACAPSWLCVSSLPLGTAAVTPRGAQEKVSQPGRKGLFGHGAFDLLCGNAVYQKKSACRR